MKLNPIMLIVMTVSAWGQSPSISGAVIGEDGSPLGSVQVVYNRVAELAADRLGRISQVGPLQSGAVITDKEGRFHVSGLLPGEYYVCALPSSEGLLGSCEWNEPYKRVQVGEQPTELILTISSGVSVTIRVTDRSASATEPMVLVGVMSPTGYYKRATMVKDEGRLRTYKVTVPVHANVSLFVDSDRQVTEGSGRNVVLKRRSIEIPTDQASTELDLVLQ